MNEDTADKPNMLDNITNAHKALSDTVNKHIEFTTTLDKVVKKHDGYNCMMQSKMMSDTRRVKEHVDKLHSYINGILILNISMVVLILWSVV